MTLATYWTAQTCSDGRWIHPDDAGLIRQLTEFNLDYPAVPFVGNPDAPVVLLMLNGGWNDIETPLEFSSANALTQHLERLASPAEADWSGVCGYYQRTRYYDLLREGQLVLVNACGYRSPKAPSTRVRHLPSVRRHQQWLLEEVLRGAEEGRRFIAAHRFSLFLPRHSQIRDAVLPVLDGVRGCLSDPGESLDRLGPREHHMEQIRRFLRRRS